MKLLPLVVVLALGVAEAARKLKKAEALAVLNEHNRIRRLVAKGEATFGNGAKMVGASDMRKLSWSNKLAKAALKWANAQESRGCGHDPSLPSLKMGENLAMTGGAPHTIDTLMGMVGANDTRSWWSELSTRPGTLGAGNTPCQIVDINAAGSPIGHATQMIWAASTQIGCAIGRCGRYDFELTCRYTETGNFRMNGIMRMYNPGKACAACPDACDDGLCTAAPTGTLSCTNEDVDTGPQGGAAAASQPSMGGGGGGSASASKDGTVCGRAGEVDGLSASTIEWLKNSSKKYGQDFCACVTKSGRRTSTKMGSCASYGI